MLFISYANESSRLDENFPGAPNSTAITEKKILCIDIASPQHLDRSLFAFVLSFFYDIKSKTIRIATVAMFTSDLNAGAVPQMSPPSHDLERLRTTMADFIVLSIQLVSMVLGVSYSRVLAQRPTGCCSASNNNNNTYYRLAEHINR